MPDPRDPRFRPLPDGDVADDDDPRRVPRRPHRPFGNPPDDPAADPIADAIQAKAAALRAAGFDPGPPAGDVVRAGDTGSRDFANCTIAYSPEVGAFEMHGAILGKYRAIAGLFLIGFPTSDEVDAANGGRMNSFQWGDIYWSPWTGAFEVHGSIVAKYRERGGPASYLGYPTSDEGDDESGGGRVSRFERGSIYWSNATGAYAVEGGIAAYYVGIGGPRAAVGFPTSDITPAPDGQGFFNRFQHGGVYWHPSTGAAALDGAIDDKYVALGATQSGLGYPTAAQAADGAGLVASFQNGVILWRAGTGAVAVLGEMCGGWRSLSGQIGDPVADAVTADGAVSQRFRSGALYLCDALIPVLAPVFDKWSALGGEGSWLGRPLAWAGSTPGGAILQRFEHGLIYVPAGGTPVALREPLAAEWLARGGEGGPLGAPLTDPGADEVVRCARGVLFRVAETVEALVDTDDPTLRPPPAEGLVPSFAAADAPPNPARTEFVSGPGHWRTLDACLRNPVARCVRAGFTLRLAPTAASSAPSLLPLRGAPTAILRDANRNEWPLEAHVDAQSGEVRLELAFTRGEGAARVADPDLYQAVKTALQSAGGAWIELSWLHAAAVDGAPYAFLERTSLTASYPPGSDVFSEPEPGWHSIAIDDPTGTRSRMYYRVTEDEGVFEFLPTGYRLGLRADGLPLVPRAYVRTDGATHYRAQLSVQVVPYVSPAEREALRAALAAEYRLPFAELLPTVDPPATFTLASSGAAADLAVTSTPQVAVGGFAVDLDVNLEGGKYGLVVAQLESAVGLAGTVTVSLTADQHPPVPAALSLPDLVASGVRLERDGRTLRLTNPLDRAVRVGAAIHLLQTGSLGVVAADGAATEPALPLVLAAGATQTVTVRPSTRDAAWAWDRIVVDPDPPRFDGLDAAAIEDWLARIDRDHAVSEVAPAFTVRLNPWPSSDPEVIGVQVRVAAEGAAAADVREQLLTDASWTTNVPLTLVQLLANANQLLTYVVEFSTVYRSTRGIPQRVTWQASTYFLQPLTGEAGARYDVLDPDGAPIESSLDAAGVRRLTDDLRAHDRCWTLRVVRPA